MLHNTQVPAHLQVEREVMVAAREFDGEFLQVALWRPLKGGGEGEREILITHGEVSSPCQWRVLSLFSHMHICAPKKELQPETYQSTSGRSSLA